jgi:hypothetical protein
MDELLATCVSFLEILPVFAASGMRTERFQQAGGNMVFLIRAITPAPPEAEAIWLPEKPSLLKGLKGSHGI